MLISNFWQLFLLSAPWLMLGLFLAGLLNVYIPQDFLKRHLGKEGFYTTIKAALIGAPMPLCSCGVIPAAIGLRRAGGSKSATTAFLVSTPETGVDSISVSYVLLGPFMAVIRPIAAICSAIVAGILVGGGKDTNEIPQQVNQVNSCCNKEPKVDIRESKLKNQSDDHFCDNRKTNAGGVKKLFDAVHFASNKLLSDTITWLLIGLFFAAIIQTYVPVSFLSQWGNGIIAMTVIILVSIPMYICATASTPIAAGLLLAGVSPGAVLVFMLAGPATNIATIGVIAKELGRRAVIAYLFGVIVVGVLFGFFTDYLIAKYGFVVSPMVAMEHEILPFWFSLLCGLILLSLIGRLIYLRLLRLI